MGCCKGFVESYIFGDEALAGETQSLTLGSTYSAGIIAGPVSDVKIAALDDDRFVIAAVGEATPEGALYNPQKAPKVYSTGREYTAMPVQDYNKWVTPQRSSIWYTTLEKDSENGRYSLAKTDPMNILMGTGLVFSVDAGFDISSRDIICIAKDTKVKQEKGMRSDFYYTLMSVVIDTAVLKPTIVTVAGLQRASSSSVFSSDERSVMFLQKQTQHFEDDKSHILIVQNIDDTSSAVEILTSEDEKGT